GSVRRTRAGVVHRSADLPEYERGRLPALPELSAGDFSGVEVLSAQLAHADSTAFIPIIGALDALARSEEQAGSHEHDVNTALLLVVDQLEELFGLAEEVIARFSKLLDLCVRCKRVWVIATLRADLFGRFLATPILKELKDEGASYALATPAAPEMAEIVCGPAVAAGLDYEKDSQTGETLDERLLQDAGRPDLLPLLQFTLNQLFEAARQSGHS